MSPTRCLITTKIRGQVSGDYFDGTPASTHLDSASISRIYVSFETYITGIEVHYVKGSVGEVTHGTTGSTRKEIILQPSELITAIEGSATNAMINHLTFITTKRTLGPFGNRSGEFFQWDAGAKVPPDVAPRMGLLAFRGTQDSYITSLQATFAEFSYGKPPSAINFEKLPTAASAKTTPSEMSLPSFAVHLMSPIITLLAGPELLKFHVHEDTLCRLPFFRAALQGEFKEASEKVIKMPEDDASSLAALVEFLSKGSYTYAYNPDTTRFRDKKSNVPIADLTQGLFHVSVYTIALKYDCPKLIDETTNNFRVVMGDLQGIDILRLWKAAYEAGLQMSAWEAGEGPTRFNEGLMKWGAMLSEKHREEMEKILGDYPALACDLLGFSSAGDSD